MICTKLINTELLVGGKRIPVGTSELRLTARNIRNWVRTSGILPTHMGELRKVDKDTYIYYTTIGATYLFERKGQIK